MLTLSWSNYKYRSSWKFFPCSVCETREQEKKVVVQMRSLQVHVLYQKWHSGNHLHTLRY